MIFVTLLLLGIFHLSILRGIGDLLICTDPLTHADAVFVLSGNPFDRSKEASKLVKEGYTDKLICTGESIPIDVLALGLNHTEADISATMAYSEGMDTNAVTIINKGTSTQEESEIILEYARSNSMDTIIVVSNKFHTRRVSQVFHKKFKNSDIHLIVHGAPASAYQEETWWQNEYGLVFVNNEYIKQVYYFLKY